MFVFFMSFIYNIYLYISKYIYKWMNAPQIKEQKASKKGKERKKEGERDWGGEKERESLILYV